MNCIFRRKLLSAALLVAASSIMPAQASIAGTQPRFKHVNKRLTVKTDPRFKILRDALKEGKFREDSLRVRTAGEIIESTEIADNIPTFNRLLAPWVFSEYYPLDNMETISIPDINSQMPRLWQLAKMEMDNKAARAEIAEADSIADRRRYLNELWGEMSSPDSIYESGNDTSMDMMESGEPGFSDIPEILRDARPEWITNSIKAWQMQDGLMYSMMVNDPSLIEYAYWQLPVPPTLPEEDHGFKGFLKRSFIPSVDVNEAVISETDIQKKHWLHVVNGALQFSQAYVSENWYQGGNNHLALLINFLWDVQLNNVWHPNLLLQSTLSYKLGLNSVEDDQYRKYSISQDIFQYNFKFGYKARRNWYYTITAQFKTQLLNNYTKNTETRIASLLTPGDLNLGIGMTYSKTNASKTMQFNASIAPLSYNLKTAIDPNIDHNLFGIEQTAKSVSEIGSNADITLNWKIGKMVTYKTRLFLFTDYDYFLGDWENTLNIQFSKLFSTQVFANLRYDTSADSALAPKWKKLMLKEILSIGLSYTFSTK